MQLTQVHASSSMPKNLGVKGESEESLSLASLLLALLPLSSFSTPHSLLSFAPSLESIAPMLSLGWSMPSVAGCMRFFNAAYMKCSKALISQKFILAHCTKARSTAAVQ